jgi:hypothetical protein
MRVASVHDPVEASGLGASNSFTIKASPKAFELLSTPYSDAILAVVREISCNAIDAHQSVGKDASTIEVHVPNIIEPHFSVRDYGPGLSVKDVTQLYTTYFASTKDDSDELIGGFGLGSKAPFAVADQFTVTSWHDGFCSEFVCYKENGQPKISMLRSAPSSETSGLKVTVSVPVTKIYLWETAIRTFFKYHLTVPTCLKDFVTPLLPGARCSSNIYADGYAHWYVVGSDFRVLMGGVSYTIDLDRLHRLKATFEEVHSWRWSSHGLLIVAPLGAVQPHISRETLNYTPSTVAWLENAIINAVSEMHASCLADFDALTTVYETRKFYFVTTKNVPFRQLLIKKLQFNGQPPQKIVYAPDSLSQASYLKLNFRVTWRIENYVYHDIEDNREQKYFWLASSPNASVYRRIREAHLNKNQSYNIGLFWGSSFTDTQKALDDAGFPPNCLEDFDKVHPLVPKPRVPRTKRAPQPVVLTGYPKLAGSKVPLDLSVPSYFVKFYKGDFENVYVRSLYWIVKSVGWIDRPLVGINKGELTKRALEQLNKAGWAEFDINFLHTLPDSKLDDMLCHHVSCELLKDVNYWPLIHLPPGTFKNNSLETALAKLRPYAPKITPTVPHNLNGNDNYWHPNQRAYYTKQLSQAITAKAEVEQALAKYPLFAYMKLPSDVPSDIIAYLST